MRRLLRLPGVTLLGQGTPCPRAGRGPLLSPQRQGEQWAALYAALGAMLLAASSPAAAELTELAARFDHPERYRALFKRLVKRGVPEVRVKALFGSPKAQRRDREALAKRTDIDRIPKHKEAERTANHRYLKKAALLVDHLDKYQGLYRLLEERFRIRREIIGAILLKESALGHYKGLKHDAFVVFNTLYDGLESSSASNPRMRRRISRLIPMAREQLIALTVFAYRRDTPLAERPIPASYAGAVGIPQWLPVHLPYAVSVGDWPPDLSRLPDAILSTANLIRNKLGWPAEMLDFDRLSNLGEIVAAWRAFDNGRASFAKGHNADGQELRRFDLTHSTMPNVAYIAQYVRSLMAYNNSSDYALGVLRIARRTHLLLRGTSTQSPESARHRLIGSGGLRPSGTLHSRSSPVAEPIHHGKTFVPLSNSPRLSLY